MTFTKPERRQPLCGRKSPYRAAPPAPQVAARQDAAPAPKRAWLLQLQSLHLRLAVAAVAVAAAVAIAVAVAVAMLVAIAMATTSAVAFGRAAVAVPRHHVLVMHPAPHRQHRHQPPTLSGTKLTNHSLSSLQTGTPALVTRKPLDYAGARPGAREARRGDERRDRRYRR